jgi:translation initiation factor IF-3
VEDALRLAQDADLDLVEVAPDARPPVVKIMDYGKYKYEADMTAREARRNQANTVLKEIRFRLKIDPHDYGTKVGHIERFLKGGDKVKVMIQFRGREQSRPEMGIRLLNKLAEDVAEFGFVESSPKQDGRNMVMVIAPVKRKAEQRNEARRAAAQTKATSPAAPVERAAAPSTAAPQPVAVAAAPVEPPVAPAAEPVTAAAPAAAAAAPTAAPSAPAAPAVRAPSPAPSRPASAPRPAAAPRPSTASRPTSAAPRPSTAATGRPAPSTTPRPAAASPARPVATPRPAATGTPRPTPASTPRPAPSPAPGNGAARPTPRPGPGPRPQAGGQPG